MMSGLKRRSFPNFFSAISWLLLFIFVSYAIFKLQEVTGFSKALAIFLNSLAEILVFGFAYYFYLGNEKPRLSISFNIFPIALIVWVFSFFLSQAYFYLTQLAGIKPDYYQVEIFASAGNFYERLLIFAGAVVMAPVAEEMFFRGVLFSRLKTEWGFLKAAITSSSVFALLHGAYFFVPLFLFGMLLCYAVDKKGSLDASIAAHILNNLVALVYYFYFSGKVV